MQIEALEKLVPDPATKRAVAAHERAPAQPRTAPAEAVAELPAAEALEIVPEAMKAKPEFCERIGEEETFEVDIVPRQLVKRRIVRSKYRHRLDRARAPRSLRRWCGRCRAATLRPGCSPGSPSPSISIMSRSTGRSRCRPLGCAHPAANDGRVDRVWMASSLR